MQHVFTERVFDYVTVLIGRGVFNVRVVFEVMVQLVFGVHRTKANTRKIWT